MQKTSASGILMFVLLFVLIFTFSSNALATDLIRIAGIKEASSLEKKAEELLTKRLTERGFTVTETDSNRADIVLQKDGSIPREGFQIDRRNQQVVLSASSGPGLIYGVGRLLRGLPQSGRLEYFGETGRSVPEKKTRGIYFATHFGNFYDKAPVTEVKRYIEDMALFGYNILMIWFDMHHYTGINDPKALDSIQRLRTFLAEAKAVGMEGGLGILANEAYSTSPKELRAVPFPHHYKVEICPSNPEGMKQILKERAEVLNRFADVVKYVWIWPYDQGGCKCEKCSPWGANGFLKCSEKVARLIRRTIPNAKIILSTWEFGYWFPDDVEWKGLYETLAKKPDWLDIVLVEHHGNYPAFVLKNGRPGGYPVVNFPEISMNGMSPWGGFGANTQIVRLENVWKSARHLLDGGFPYSEGIYEDLNKFLFAQFYWSPNRSAESIVREYVHGFFSRESENEITEAIFGLDGQLGHYVNWTKFPEASAAMKAGKGFDQLAGVYIFKSRNKEKTERPFELLEGVRSKLPENVQKSWRWLMIYCRAGLDAEFTSGQGKPTVRTEAYFKTISEISFDGQVPQEVIQWLQVPRLQR